MAEMQEVSKVEHLSLKDKVESLADSMAGMVDMQRKDREDFHKTIADFGNNLYEAIGKVDAKRQNDNKVPYPLLTLILGGILAVAGLTSSNSERIEEDSKERDKAVDTVVQREMRILDAAIDSNVKSIESRLEKVSERLNDSDREFIAAQARNAERVKMLFELRAEGK